MRRLGAKMNWSLRAGVLRAVCVAATDGERGKYWQLYPGEDMLIAALLDCGDDPLGRLTPEQDLRRAVLVTLGRTHRGDAKHRRGEVPRDMSAPESDPAWPESLAELHGNGRPWEPC